MCVGMYNFMCTPASYQGSHAVEKAGKCREHENVFFPPVGNNREFLALVGKIYMPVGKTQNLSLIGHSLGFGHAGSEAAAETIHTQGGCVHMACLFF